MDYKIYWYCKKAVAKACILTVSAAPFIGIFVMVAANTEFSNSLFGMVAVYYIEFSNSLENSKR